MKKTLLLLTLCLWPLSASAQSPEEKGLAIAVEADRRDAGFKDNLADMVMILKNKHGEEIPCLGFDGIHICSSKWLYIFNCSALRTSLAHMADQWALAGIW